MGTQPSPVIKSPYSAVNAAVRIEMFDDVPEIDFEVAVRAFCRNLGIAHLYEERILPTLKEDDSAVFAGIIDRHWPPWGLGAHTVLALCQIHLVGDKRYGVSPVFASRPNLTNFGLQAAVFKEALEQISKKQGEVNYLVRDGALFSSRLLTSVGFSRVNEYFKTDVGQYAIHRAPAADVLKRLGLDASAADLLAEDLDPAAFTTVSSFLGGLSLAPGSLTREIIAIDGGLDDSLPPATINSTRLSDPWDIGDIGPIVEGGIIVEGGTIVEG
jgi:hypothetical protein